MNASTKQEGLQRALKGRPVSFRMKTIKKQASPYLPRALVLNAFLYAPTVSFQPWEIGISTIGDSSSRHRLLPPVFTANQTGLERRRAPFICSATTTVFNGLPQVLLCLPHRLWPRSRQYLYKCILRKYIAYTGWPFMEFFFVSYMTNAFYTRLHSLCAGRGWALYSTFFFFGQDRMYVFAPRSGTART